MAESFVSCPGMQAFFVENRRFRTTSVSINFYVPLEKETVSSYALLASLLTTCGASFEDFSELNFKLTQLYGADLSSALYKVGDALCVKFCISTINDAYALRQEHPLGESVALLLDLLFHPKVRDGAFEQNDLKREKRMLIEHIRGELNNKRAFARMRLLEEMYVDEPYGLYRYGREELVEAMTGESVYQAYQTLMKTALIKVFVIGQAIPEGLTELLTRHFADREPQIDPARLQTTATVPAEAVKRVTDRMEVAQGKLVMGFSCKAANDPDAVATMVMCDLFGGGPYSRLFSHVREEMSLCYYCSASCVRQKGFLMVDSGVEAANAEKASEAILMQLKAVQEGAFTDFEREASIRSLISSVLSNRDSLSQLDDWYTIKGLEEDPFTPEELAQQIKLVTRDQIVKAAQTVRLHTVYQLLPKEGLV